MQKDSLLICSALALGLVGILSSCNSMKALGEGDIIGGVIGAPFEIAAGAIETATVPLSGQRPQWIRDAEIANMKVGKPKIDDPAWRSKFSNELAAGDVLLVSFDENLSAYRYTKNEKYLSRAEQLLNTPEQRSLLDEAVLQALGGKAFDVGIRINGSTAKAEYGDKKTNVLFISGEVRGAKVHPTGSAQVTLRNDLPFAIKDTYEVTYKFTFTIPRQSTMLFMGMIQKTDRNSVSTNTRTVRITPSTRTASCNLDFGQMNGAATVAVMGSRSKIEVTGKPFASYEIVSIKKS